MMTPSPCFDHEAQTDCPNRHIGCRESCDAWKEWQVIHKREKEQIRKQKDARDDIDHFERERRKRDAAAKMRQRRKEQKK